MKIVLQSEDMKLCFLQELSGKMAVNHINESVIPVGDVDALRKAMCEVAGNEELTRRLS